MSQQKRVNPTIITLIIVALIAAGAGGFYLLNQNKDEAKTNSTPNTETARTTETGQSGETTVTTYANGTYEADGSYSTPGGTESITVTATLADGVITDVKATGSATGGNSAQYQSQFLSNFASQVEGKAVDEVSLSRVAGSSLTSTGFNRALDTIKSDARS